MTQALRIFAGLLAISLMFVTLNCGGRATGAGGNSANLLEGLTARQSRDIRCVSCLTDASVAPDGGQWDMDGTALFERPEGFVEYDLGKVLRIRAAWLQGDNNDSYQVAVSADGAVFTPLWSAGPVNRPGLQGRAQHFDASARYVRITASGGDRNYSLTEVQLFAEPPETLPAGVHTLSGITKQIQVRGRILAFGLALIVLLVLAYRKAPWWWLGLVGLVPFVVGFGLVSILGETWPQQQREVSLIRGTIAVVAAVALLRELWGPARFPAHRGVVLGVLGFCGVVGFLAFYNLGVPQFRDYDLGKPTYVHQLDLRQYYPTAKYFPEIGYRSMYEADVAAYLEDHPGTPFANIEQRALRNLGDLQVSTIGRERQRIEAAPRLFSAARWDEYKSDARYFRAAMGDRGYFQTFYDMGGNATPVWIAITHLLFDQFEASDAAFARTALFDVILILGAFVAVGIVFGPRTAFLGMIIFGANDFIMYGSNWGGATLRHDWMAYLAFGACALRRRRFVLAGALLALATSMRAFPALALVCLSFPAAWWLIEHFKQHRRLPSRAELRRELRAPFIVLLSATLTGGLLFIGSSLLLGLNAWSDWYLKVGQLSADPHGNHISLRSLLAGYAMDQPLVLADRMPLFLAAVVFFVGLVFAACRGQRYEQAAVLGLVLTPVLFYPANYYIHLVWLLPLVMLEQRKPDGPLSTPFDKAHTSVGLALLGMCAAQYFTVLETDRGLHFYMASVLLFAALTFLLVTLVRRNAALAVASIPTEQAPAEPRPRARQKRRRTPGSGQHAAQ